MQNIELMFSNCPAPYPDELLYSLIARHGWLQTSDSHKRLIRRLFVTNHALAVVDLPARLRTLHESGHLWAGWDHHMLLQQHTLFPLYSAFIPRTRVQQIEQDLAGERGGAIHLRAGIMASKVRLPFYLRFCPCCASEERERTGEAYWHRLHQVPGVMVCPTHNVFLEESSIETQMRRSRQAFMAAEDAIPTKAPIRLGDGITEHLTLLRIATGAAWLLGNPIRGTELGILRARYLVHATKLGYATASGRIRWKVLLREFDSRFSAAFLEQLQAPLLGRKSDHWLARILRNPRAVQAPIRHLVLMDFLGLIPETFYRTNVPLPLFGVGPWHCDNSVCPDRGEPKITKVEYMVSPEHRESFGVFTCPTCGQVKCRTIQTGWVRDHGTLWKSELEKLWNDAKISVRQIAKQLGVDSLTVKRHAAKLGLQFPRKGKRVSGKNGPPKVGRAMKDIKHDLECRKAEWLDHRTKNPSLSTSGLRRLAPACYTYLYRNCREWLKGHCPQKIRPAPVAPRVNWPARDLELSKRVIFARKQLLLEAGQPQRLSVAAFGRELGALGVIQKHLSKLPLTRANLAAAQESKPVFARRRQLWNFRFHAGGQKSKTTSVLVSNTMPKVQKQQSSA